MSGIDQNIDNLVQHLQEQNKKLEAELAEAKAETKKWFDSSSEFANHEFKALWERDHALESVKMAESCIQEIARHKEMVFSELETRLQYECSARETLAKLKSRHHI